MKEPSFFYQDKRGFLYLGQNNHDTGKTGFGAADSKIFGFSAAESENAKAIFSVQE